MRFVVLPVRGRPERTPATASLVTDDWNDYWDYRTLYDLFVCDSNGVMHSIGEVKIGQFNWSSDQLRPRLPEVFEGLGDEFFSVGQDVSYYERLRALSWTDRMAVLVGLRDVVNDEPRFARARGERVTQISLTRSVSLSTIEGQFRRVLNGGATLSEFRFAFRVSNGSPNEQVSFDFVVTPGSNPPSNIHVLIGRNGVGKTRFLNILRDTLIKHQEAAASVTEGQREALFANAVSVSFSAFDDFQPRIRQARSDPVQYSYIGLRVPLDESKERHAASENLEQPRTKTPDELAKEFGDSALQCFRGARLSRWRRALEMLQADPIFSDANIAALADLAEDFGISEPSHDEFTTNLREQAVEIYQGLSSGHKIVLLTITRLVELVAEKSMVLIDEPEAHLHPPLLSALVRALSDLLINRNGVAVIATHSPVVLQEVPRKCVWKLRRVGRRWVAERPNIETFGENVGILTTEVFGLEVTQSGFHKLLQSKVDEGLSMHEILEHFDEGLGGEGRSILRAMIADRDTAVS